MSYAYSVITHEPLQIINPSNDKLVMSYPQMSNEEINQLINHSQGAFKQWRRFEFDQRAKLMHKVADLLRTNQDELAKLMAEEMGKVYAEGIAEIEKCAWVCDYYADNAEAMLADEEIKMANEHNPNASAFISYQPIGIVLAVMPWNFPFWQAFRFAAPTLMAGNTGLLKHASSVTGCALAIESIFKEAGFPLGVFSALVIDKHKVESVIEHKYVRAVTLTGSTEAGSQVASLAGKYIKKSVLELGGSDPYIVLSDADIPLAAEKCCQSRMINAGQSCIAAKRFIVVADVYDEFIQQFKAKMQDMVIGDPLDKSSDYGPQANSALRDKLHDQVLRSINQGANCILGGEIPEQAGAWYPATILIDVKPGMPAYYEELFGPVAAVIKAENAQHAIDIANDSDFGLGGAIFSKNTDLARELARNEIDTGCVALNDFVKSDPRIPFGGVKTSGYGRELSSFGIKEFVNIKTICQS